MHYIPSRFIHPSLLVTVPAAFLSAGISLAAAPDEQPIIPALCRRSSTANASPATPGEEEGQADMTSLELLTKGGDSGKPALSRASRPKAKSTCGSACQRITTITCRRGKNPSRQKMRSRYSNGGSTAAPSRIADQRCRSPDNLKPSVLELAQKSVEKPKEAPKPVITPKELDPPTKEAITKLQGFGATILQIPQSEAGQIFTAINVADKFYDAELAKFAPIAASWRTSISPEPR